MANSSNVKSSGSKAKSKRKPRHIFASAGMSWPAITFSLALLIFALNLAYSRDDTISGGLKESINTIESRIETIETKVAKIDPESISSIIAILEKLTKDIHGLDENARWYIKGRLDELTSELNSN